MILIYYIRYIPTVKNIISKEKISVRLREGITYLKQRPLLFYFGNASYTVFIFTLISVHLLWPVYIENHLSELGDTYAITKVNYAIGALFAGFFISIIFRKVNIVASIISMMLLAFSCYVLLAFSQSKILLFVFALGIGLSNAGIRIQRVTFLFNHIPNHIIGRTNSVFQSINILLRSLFIGLFSIPFFAEGSNILWTFVIAAFMVLVSLIPLIYKYKALRDIKKETSTSD